MADLDVPSSCNSCRHRRWGTRGCDAFPDDIPLEISTGKHDQLTRYPNDHGITYDPA
ncbi:MAG TPA: hypothetical protein VH539_15590 [Gemmatimonadaceae bacterium]